MPRVAFQGESGAYSEVAVIQLFPDAEPWPSTSFREVFDRVQAGAADWGVIPVENSLTGSIKENDDLLAEHALTLVGETIVAVQHCVMTLPGQRLADIRTVLSHPQGLEQCRAFLSQLGAEQVPTYDTAGSAKIIRQEQRAGAAAIASRRAAEIYRLEILAEGIQDQPDNFTRFLAIALPSRPQPFERSAPRKTSLLLGLANEPGSLHQALGVLARRDIQLTRLESRPNRRKPWEYLFTLDFEGDLQDPRIQEALADLEHTATTLVPLGSYPMAPMP
jgi:prephenate dehydratase